MDETDTSKETWTVEIDDVPYIIPEEVGELFKTVSEERDHYKEIVENVVFGLN